METIISPKVLIEYNGHNVTADFSPYLIEVSYIDYEKEQSDELNIVLKDDGRFMNSWRPVKGDKLSCTMFLGSCVENKCGTFTIDEVEFNGDESGDTCTIKALAVSINQSVRTRYTRGYKGKTLVQIAKEIGKRHGFKVAGALGNVVVSNFVQKNETDLQFLNRLASLYGYIFKITDNVLTFIRQEDLEGINSLLKVDKTQIKSYSFNDTGSKKYDACSVSYYDPKTKTLKTYTAKSGTATTKKDVLKLKTRCSSLDAAKRMANNALKNSSQEITCRIEFKNAIGPVCAGVNIGLMSDFGYYNGKYHLTQTSYRVTSGTYEITAEGHRL